MITPVMQQQLDAVNKANEQANLKSLDTSDPAGAQRDTYVAAQDALLAQKAQLAQTQDKVG